MRAGYDSFHTAQQRLGAADWRYWEMSFTGHRLPVCFYLKFVAYITTLSLADVT